MVLRVDAVRERLKKLEETISRLRELGVPDPQTLKSDFRQAWLAERGLEIAIQAILDIGSHILAGHFGETSRSYEEILRKLGEREVIDPDLEAKLRGLGGFRNVLVHDYLALDPAKVREALKRAPVDFTDFQAAILAWLDTID